MIHDRMPLDCTDYLPPVHRVPLGESWPVVGPKKRLYWLSRGDDGVYVLSPEREITEGVPIGRLHGLMAAEQYGNWVFDMHAGETVRVWQVSGREWGE